MYVFTHADHASSPRVREAQPQNVAMFIKLNRYRQAGVREYWIIDPDKKLIMTFRFEDRDDYAVYHFHDKVPVGIYGGDCVIDFALIDYYVSPWMD